MPVIRKTMPFVLLAALALASCAGASSASGASGRTLTVTGTGSVKQAPDLAIVTLGVQTQDADVGQAVGENNRRMGRVMAAMGDLGVPSEDIRTTFYNVTAQPKFDELGNPTAEVASYLVDNTIEIRLRKVDQLGSLLQAALTKGANTVQGVSFTIEDPTEPLQKARIKAMEDAGRQAGLLAEKSGVQLGKIRAVSEGGPVAAPLFQAAYGKGGGGGTPVSPGTVEYQVQITVVYELH
jgi:uncharacterized protein YggE